MIIEATRFGKINYDRSDIIIMARGLFGFDDRLRFIIVSPKNEEPFKWLQSLDDPDLAFLMIDASYFKPNYEVEIKPDDLVILNAADTGDVDIFVLISIPREHPELMSANLLAPLAINKSNMNGVQLVLNDRSYSSEHLFFGELAARLHKAPVESED